MRTFKPKREETFDNRQHFYCSFQCIGKHSPSSHNLHRDIISLHKHSVRLLHMVLGLVSLRKRLTYDQP